MLRIHLHGWLCGVLLALGCRLPTPERDVTAWPREIPTAVVSPIQPPKPEYDSGFSPPPVQWAQHAEELSLEAPDQSAPRAPSPALGPPNEKPVDMPMRPIDPPPEPLPAGLTRQALEEMAVRNSPVLAEAVARVDALRGKWLQAGLLPNPAVGYSGAQLGSGRTEQQGVYLEQEFITAGKLRLDRAVTSQEIARAENEFSAQELRLRTDVRRAYYDVLAAQRQVEIAEQLVRIGLQGTTAAEQLHRAKETSEIDVLQARIEADQSRILRQNARNRQQAAWQRLTTVIGLPDLALQPVAGSLADEQVRVVYEAALHRLLQQSPEFAAAVADVERARWGLQRAWAQRQPNVNVQALVVRDNDIDGVDGMLQVSVPLPVFNRNQGGIAQAERELAAAEQAQTRMHLGLRNRFASVYERYANARQEADTYSQSIVPNAAKSLELVAQAYRAGEQSFLNYLTAQRTYSQTLLAYLESLRELHVAATEIEGLLLTDSLAAPRP